MQHRSGKDPVFRPAGINSKNNGVTPLNGAGYFANNVAMDDSQYRGVKKTIETKIAQGDMDGAYETARNAQPQMNQQQWADIARRIYEMTSVGGENGLVIDKDVWYKKSKDGSGTWGAKG